jgi:hypothetical protein
MIVLPRISWQTAIAYEVELINDIYIRYQPNPPHVPLDLALHKCGYTLGTITRVDDVKWGGDVAGI